MASAIYVLPIEEVLVNGTTARGPLYFKWRFGTGTLTSPWGLIDYGRVPWGIVGADTSPADHAFLLAQSDVRYVDPATFDSAVGGAAGAIQTYLEKARIPAGWVSSANTWREILRAVAGLFLFAQRYTAVSNGAALVLSTAALNLRMNQLSAQVRADLQTVATSLGYDTSAITPTTTFRQALKILADQWGAAPITVGPVTI